MSDTNYTSKIKRKKSEKKLNKISFDEEVVPKSIAQQLNNPDHQKNPTEANLKSKPRKNKIKHKITAEKAPSVHSESNEPKKQKRKKKSLQSVNKEANENPEHEENLEASEEQLTEEPEVNSANPVGKQEESKRSKQRKKHQQLLIEKKIKVDLVLQEKSLNYLSRWKHNRSEWKFEKLRQVWLQQNMFDCDRVPDKFWETLVEYFSSAQGKIRKTILDDALKIIEESEHAMDRNNEDKEKESDDDSISKVQRARSMIQCLQE